MCRPSRGEKVKLLVQFYMISPDCHAVLLVFGRPGGSWSKEFADIHSENNGKGEDVVVRRDATLRFDVRKNVARDYEVRKSNLQLRYERVLSPLTLEAEFLHFAPD